MRSVVSGTLGILSAAAFLSIPPQSESAQDLRDQVLKGSGSASIHIVVSDKEVSIAWTASRSPAANDRVFFAFRSGHSIGSAVLPFEREAEGSTLFLPFKADQLISVAPKASAESTQRRWTNWTWANRSTPEGIEVSIKDQTATAKIARSAIANLATLDCLVYGKDLSQNGGWGQLTGCSDPTVGLGSGDKYVPHYLEIDLKGASKTLVTERARLFASGRVRIYQLFVRLFGNTNETRKQNGTLNENGVGKFADINDAALASLKDLGFTHLWLTGVLQQATAADYSAVGQPADDPDLLKGLAGSPYAIKDYFDVCPDYATDPAKRLDEFKELLNRIHQHKLKAIIDLVPNHVARSYNSDIKPDQNFGSKGNGGKGDDTSMFFNPQNNFFYLKPDGSGPPLHLPTCRDGKAISPTCKVLETLNQGACDGLFDGEKQFGRVTGNNKISWTPDINDWYETVKLNYGFDFTSPDKSVREYPNAKTPNHAIPDTWRKIDSVIAYWQGLGVDGFRCDMSHMVPPEFWNWAIDRARQRQSGVLFIGEAYDNDPAKVPSADPVISQLAGGKSNVMFDLLNAGFNGVYDDPTYRAIKKIFEGPGWANDIDQALTDDFIFDSSLRYAENHDEVRIAAKSQWGGLGMKVGPPVAAILYGLSRGPILMYNGQEVGEPGAGVEGFGGEDARTSIFDYWSMPELVKWVNDHKYDGGKLSEDQTNLRHLYGRLVNLAGEPAFRDGIFIRLNEVNRDNPKFGRIGSETPSGHWLFGFLRYDARTSQRFLVLVNLHPQTLMGDVRVKFSKETLSALDLDTADPKSHINLRDRLVENEAASGGGTIAEALEDGLPVDEMPALTPRYFELAVKPPK
jgi:glycosidase